ncbi:MAG: VCBS domain-containing protein [Rubripirellula sp.]|nr:VCBS domain-containing protein [Rubripirellula sp.]
MRNLRSLFSNSLLFGSKRRRREANRVRNQNSAGRRLSTEALEKRELLAGDVGISGSHNYHSRFDVNSDLAITVQDALVVLNAVARGTVSGEEQSSDSSSIYADVNNDGRVSASDALGVINAVGRGEGVGDELVELFLTARDVNDDAISPDGFGAYNVNVDEKFFLEVSYSDLRTGGEATGIFQIKTDIIASLPGYLEPVMTETQTLRLDEDIYDSLVTTTQSVTFAIEGSTVTHVAPATQFQNGAGVTEVLAAMTVFGYTFGADYTMDPNVSFDDGDKGYEIHWIGDQYDGVDLPNISLTVQQNGGTALEVSVADFAPFLVGPDGQMNTADDVPNTDAVKYNINTHSRTLSFFATADSVYNSLQSGDYDTELGSVPSRSGYINVGGVGPASSNGIPGIDTLFNGLSPNDAFSLPVKITQPVQGLVLNVEPAFSSTNEALLIYGFVDGVEPGPLEGSEVHLDTPGTSDAEQPGVAYVIINALGDNRDPEVTGPITETYTEDDISAEVDLLEGASDPDNNPLSVANVTTTGDVSGIVITDNKATVHPSAYNSLAALEEEVITISYDIVDGASGSVAQTATITITGLNDPATGITGDTTGSVTEDGTLAANGSLTVADVDMGEDEVLSQTDSSGIYGTFSVLASGSWTYSLNNTDSVVQALAAGAAPTDTFTVTSKDGAATVDVIITINGVNDAPTKGAPVTATFSEENEPTSVDLLTGASDVDQGDVLNVANYVVASGDAVGVSQNGNDVDVDPGAYGILEDGESEVVVLNYDIVDNNGGSVDQTATITVTGVSNFSPVITVEVGDGVVGEVNELAATPATVDAITSPSGSLVSSSTTGPGTGYNYGWEFTVDQPIKISELGAYIGTNFESVNAGLTNPDVVRVGLWDVSTSKRVTYVDLKRSNYSGQQGGFAYKAIGPIALPAGGSYRISVRSGIVPLEFFSHNGSQTLAGSGVLTSFQGGYAGQFPGAVQYPNQVVTGNSGGFVGGNFKWHADTATTVEDTLSFTDADPADTHSVSTAATEADYVGTFSASLTPAVNGVGGEVAWSFSAIDAELDQLAKDEVRPQIYDVTVTDSNGGTDVEQVTIALNGVNDQPHVTEPIARVFNSGMAVENIDLLTGAVDVDGDVIRVGDASVLISGGDASGVLVDAANSIVTVTPSAYIALNVGEQEVVEITYTIVDDMGGVVDQTATLTFNGLNDPPTAGSPISATFTQNDVVSTVSLTTGATDPENDPLTVDEVSFDPANPIGFQIVNNDSVQVTPSEYASLNDGENAQVQINYVIADGAGNQTPQQTATITITGLNDSATIEGDATGDVVEDTAVTNGQLTTDGTLVVNDVDTGQAIFSVAVTGQAGNLGSLEVTEVGLWFYTLDNSLSSVQELAAGSQITDIFTVASLDGTATEDIEITITGVNDVAVISGNNEGGVTEDDSDPNLTTSGNLSVTDVDAGEATFATTVVKLGSELGDLTVDAAGAWNYTLDNTLPAVQALATGATLVEEFEVKSFDQGTVETVTVTITGINDVPFFGGDSTGSVTEDASPTLTTTGALTIVDVDTGESFVSTTVSSTGTLGNLTTSPTGDWNFDVDSTLDAIQALTDGDTLQDTFTVTSFDGSQTQEVTIMIHGTNDDPEANDETRLALKDDVNGILIDVLANDNAGAGGLEIQSITITGTPILNENPTAGAVGGTVAIENNQLRYIPNMGFEGTAEITYEITDAQGLTDMAVVTVSVVDFVPSTLGGSVFIDHVENFRDVRDNGADPIRNGVQDDDEKGFASVRIKLVSSDNYTGSPIEREVLTDSEGYFQFTNVVPGVYQVVYEYPDEIVFIGDDALDVMIPALGDVHQDDLNFGVIGLQGAALSTVGLLASSYLRTNATMEQLSNGGREGGMVSLGDDNEQSFLVLGSGYEDVQFAEVELVGSNFEFALLTIVKENGERHSTMLSDDYFVLSADNHAIQFFGGMNDLVFSAADPTEGDAHRKAVDDYMMNNVP